MRKQNESKAITNNTPINGYGIIAPYAENEDMTILNEDGQISARVLDTMAMEVVNNGIMDVATDTERYATVTLYDTVQRQDGTLVDTINITRKEDIDTIKAIQGYQKIGKLSSIRIATLFASLIDNGFIDRYPVFKGIGDLGSKLFGFKAASASVYLAIGRTFFDKQGNPISRIFGDMSIGQLQELCKVKDKDGKIDIDAINAILAENELNEYSKTATIRKAVKAYIEDKSDTNTGDNVDGNTGDNVDGNTGDNVDANTGDNVVGNTGGNAINIESAISVARKAIADKTPYLMVLFRDILETVNASETTTVKELQAALMAIITD